MWVLWPLLPSAAAFGTVSIESLIQPDRVTDIRISPDGAHLAARLFHEDKHVLAVYERASLKQVGTYALAGRAEVGNFYWANGKRLIGEVWNAPSDQAEPLYYGELFAVNFDGSRSELLFGFRAGERETGTRVRRKEAENAWARIIDPLPGDERHVLISVTTWSDGQGHAPRASLLDVYSGRERKTLASAEHGDGEFYTDRQGHIRLITSRRDDGSRHVGVRAEPDGEWRSLDASSYGSYFTPVGITEAGTSAYVLDNASGDRLGLYELALDGSSYQQIYVHDRVDVTNVVMSSDGRSPYALRVDDGYPSYLMLTGAHPEGEVFRSLLATFPGHLVDITSASHDGRFWIVRVSTDVDDAIFHLFDRSKNEIRLLFAAREVDGRALQPVEPITFASFDERPVHGYFTRGQIDGEGVPPLVVLLHGGPAVRDYWGFDPEVQTLVTRGYSVLQINYRGSQGYGEVFEDLGDRQWGDAVQRDVIAGTRWAIAEGRAAADRVCVMGASFGAYSAVQSALLEPELFRCVVANAGIYDLPLLYRRGDVAELYWGPSYLQEAVGEDQAELQRYSPVHQIESLRAPVLIAHGRQDERAPFQHAQRLRDALERHDKRYVWFVKNREAHGFYDTANQLEYLDTVLAFLDEHLSR